LERSATLRRVQVAGELDHGRIVERRLAVQIAARREDEQRAPNGSVALVLRKRDLLAR
jgi:hypothetical protein